MLTLYVKTGCPFCQKVLDVGEELGLTFVLKNVADPAVAAELIAHEGRKQEPYLIDSARGIEMAESDAIVEYLHGYYMGNKVP